MSKLDDLLARDGWTPIGDYIAPLGEVSRTRAPYPLIRFCRHAHKTPQELLAWQASCLDRAKLVERREVFRFAQAYINGLDGTKNYKVRDYTTIASFFRFHDVPLDADPSWRIHGTKPQNVGCLTLEELRAILTAAQVRQDYAMHSMIWCQFQSFSGVAEISYINKHGSSQILKQLKETRDPARIDMLKSRKENDRPWFTYLGTDAINALREYFDKTRGWPEPGETIWHDNQGKTMSSKVYSAKFLSLTRHVKIVPKATKGPGVRYNKNPHKLRNLARSLVHAAHSEEHQIEGKKMLFDQACPEFWMGHSYRIDPMRYNEFWNYDPDLVRRQYVIASKYLNLTTGRQESKINLETAVKVFQDMDLVDRALEVLASRKKQLEQEQTLSIR